MHIPPNLFAAVARGELPRELQDEIVLEHLAALCPVCAETILEGEALRHRPTGPVPVEPRDPAERPVERLRRRMGLPEIEFQRRVDQARGWVKAAVKLPPEERRGKVFRAYVRFQGPLFCLLLLDEARSRIPGDPAEARSLADAVLAANKKSALYRPDPGIDAPALAVRGNATRALGRLREAEEDLEEARRLLSSPRVLDPATPAEVHNYLGSLRKDQGRFQEAAHHLHRAAALYRLVRDWEKAARELVTLSAIHYYRREFPAAVATTEEALDLLADRSDPWLLAYARYNLAFHLHAAGETERAEAELTAHEELIESASDQLANLVVWLRARIAWSREDLPAARRLFTEARERALERGIPWDAALVGLELALVHLAEGRPDRAQALAAEALPVFAEQAVERETRAALELLEAAVRREALERELFERAIAALEAAGPARPAAPRGPA